MMTRIVTILLAALSLLPAGCDDSGPEPTDDTTMTEPEHMGDGNVDDYEACLNDSDCDSGLCRSKPTAIRPENWCVPAPCIDDGKPDYDGANCRENEDCMKFGELYECRVSFCTAACA